MSLNPYLSRQLLTVLAQGRAALEGLDGDVYRQSPVPIATSSVGEHMRHVLDAIECLVAGAAERRVDYDQRERDEATEREAGTALARIAAIEVRIGGWSERDATPLRVRADAPGGANGSAQDASEDDGWIDSTIGRELMYLVNHTIHHYAIIGMILRHQGVALPDDFGVAPSTLRYWKEAGRCAPRVG